MASHIYMENPQEYGVKQEKIKVSLGFRPSEDAFANLREELKIAKERLDTIDRSLLTEPQQDTYDLYRFSIESQTTLYQEKFDGYHCFFDGVSGLHTQLPVVFSEFSVRSEQDIQNMITLLQDTQDYMNAFLRYAEAQQEQGTLLSDCAAVAQYCQDIAAEGTQGKLFQEIESRLDHINLTDTQKEDYLRQIGQAYGDHFLPAYQEAAQVMATLAEKGSAQGYASMPEGKAYYEALFQSQMGTSKTVEETRTFLEEVLKKELTLFAKTAAQNPQALQFLSSNAFQSPYQSYADALAALERLVKANYPDIGETAYTVGTVPASIAGDNVAAYFVVPALDSRSPRTIKVNAEAGTKQISDVSTFLVLAHEGFPGHLYQSAYASRTLSDQPWRIALMKWQGYTEGYASYVQLQALQYLGFDTSVNLLYQTNLKYQWCVSALLEIGIHAEGWSLEEAQAFLKRCGLQDADSQIYHRLVTAPGIYMPYYAGGLMFTQYRERAENALGESFDEKEYHDAILSGGNITFDLLEKKIETYIGAYTESFTNAVAA